MWLSHVQGAAVADYIGAVNRVNAAKRPLRLGIVAPGGSAAPGGGGDTLRLSGPELSALAQLSAAEQLALAPPPRQPCQREVLQREVEAIVRAERRTAAGGGFCAAAAARLQLSGDSLAAPSPTGEVRVTIGPDAAAAEGDMDLLEVSAKQFDGTVPVDGVDGEPVSCRCHVACIGQAFRAGLRLQLPHCAASTATLAAFHAPAEHGPWTEIAEQRASFSEEQAELELGQELGPGWVVVVRRPEYAEAASSGVPQRVTPEDLAYLSFAPVERPAAAVNADELDGPAVELRRERAEAASRPDTQHGGTSARPPTAVDGPHGIRAALSSVYRCHRPAKLSSVDRLLREWAGRELALLEHERRKYGASSRLRLAVDTDHTVSATLGPLLSEADTAGAVAVHGPFRVVRGEWYTLALNLGHGNSRVESGASRGAGIYLNLRQSVEPQRYLGQRRTEFLLRVRANAAADAAAQLSRQLRECDRLRQELAALTPDPRSVIQELPPEGVSIKIYALPAAEEEARRLREEREADVAVHALPTDFVDGFLLSATTSTGQPRYYCGRCRAMFEPWPGKIKCADCGRLATRKQVAKLGVRMAAERIGVSCGAPEPAWAAAEVVERAEAEAARGRAEAEAEAKARAAALGKGGDEPTSSRACVVQ